MVTAWVRKGLCPTTMMILWALHKHGPFSCIVDLNIYIMRTAPSVRIALGELKKYQLVECDKIYGHGLRLGVRVRLTRLAHTVAKGAAEYIDALIELHQNTKNNDLRQLLGEVV